MAGFYDDTRFQPPGQRMQLAIPDFKKMKRAKVTSPQITNPPIAPMIQSPQGQGQGQGGSFGDVGSQVSIKPPPLYRGEKYLDRGFPNPTLGIARTSSSTSPMQEWQVPVGAVEHPGEFQPPPIGAAWEGFTSGGGGGSGGHGPGLGGFDTSVMPSVANAQLSNFFGRNVGELAGQEIDQAIGDEAVGRNMWQREHMAGLESQRLQHQLLAKQLEQMPQDQKMRLLEILPGLQYMMQTPVTGPDGQMHMQTDPRMRQAISGALEPFLPSTSTSTSAGTTPSDTQSQSQPQPQPQPQQPTASFGRSALHALIPGLAGSGGWALGAMAAPETGGLSLAIPAIAGLVSSYLGGKAMDVADPGFGSMKPNAMGEGAGALAGLVGGYKGMKAFRGGGGGGAQGMPPLTEAEQALEAATGGAGSAGAPSLTPTSPTSPPPGTLKSLFGEQLALPSPRTTPPNITVGATPRDPTATATGFGAGGHILTPRPFPNRPPPPNATASQLLMLGFSPEQVQAILAHQKMSTGSGVGHHQ